MEVRDGVARTLAGGGGGGGGGGDDAAAGNGGSASVAGHADGRGSEALFKVTFQNANIRMSTCESISKCQHTFESSHGARVPSNAGRERR